MNAPTLKNKQANQRGFTIIEVVLVLAIAALIFLMVFIALPALQRNQRDTARKTAAGKVASAIVSYQSNNRGSSPSASATTWTAFANYVDGTANSPSVGITTFNDYTLERAGIVAPATTRDPNATVDRFTVVSGAKCNTTSQATTTGASAKNHAVLIRLENGSANYCQDV